MPVEKKPLDKMTVKELREVAKEIPEITGASAMKKDDLLAEIKKAKGIDDESPASSPEPRKKSKPRKSKIVSIQDCKKEIIKLRKNKENSDNTEDKKEIAVLRRRINRLKKKSRKIGKSSK